MLLRFVVENYASFREAAELSFLSTARKDAPTFRLASEHADQGVLPVVGIWGANASGKSNLIDAFLFLRRAVGASQAKWSATQPIQWRPWRMDPGSEPTRIDLELVLDAETDPTGEETRYQFGFRFDADAFVEEWAFRWGASGRRQVLYHRDVAQPDAPFYFGPSLKGARQAIATMTRRNSLFLSAAAQQNHEQLLPLYRAIVDGVRPARLVALQGHPVFEPDDVILDPAFRPQLLKLLRAADLGISGIEIETIDEPSLPPNAEEVFQPDFLATVLKHPQRGQKRILLQHGDDPEARWTAPPSMESRGTQVLLARLSDVVSTLREGNALIVDELDTSLHPDLCAELVALFTNPEVNIHGAQILFTTHDRDLLDLLRTDEAVMVDKSRAGTSSMAAGSDYRLRTRDRMRTLHKQGRMGGVPVTGDFAAAVRS